MKIRQSYKYDIGRISDINLPDDAADLETFLKSISIYESFIVNSLNYHWDILEISTRRSAIDGMCTWSNTNEGTTFWSMVNEKWISFFEGSENYDDYDDDEE
jgi:hypothetical protein